jgi:hypothetical protein
LPKLPPITNQIHVSVPRTQYSDVISELRKLQTDRKCTLHVDRSEIFHTGCSHIKQSHSENSPLEIEFQTGGLAEKAINLGGPNKEFFTLFLQEFLKKELAMFEGQGRCLLPIYNQRAVEGRLFECLGKAVVLSQLVSGPGFPYLAPYLVKYLLGEEFMHELSLTYVINTHIKEYIIKVSIQCMCIFN